MSATILVEGGVMSIVHSYLRTGSGSWRTRSRKVRRILPGLSASVTTRASSSTLMT
jgi:hypothetical protein